MVKGKQKSRKKKREIPKTGSKPKAPRRKFRKSSISPGKRPGSQTNKKSRFSLSFGERNQRPKPKGKTETKVMSRKASKKHGKAAKSMKRPGASKKNARKVSRPKKPKIEMSLHNRKKVDKKKGFSFKLPSFSFPHGKRGSDGDSGNKEEAKKLKPIKKAIHDAKKEHERISKESERKKLKPINFKEPDREDGNMFSVSAIKKLDLRTKTETAKKMKTGISGLDKMFKQGIPKGAAVLIEGGPGSGKTIMCLQMAKNICEAGGRALYMSFEEPESRLIDHMREFGWDPMKYIKNNQLLIKRYSAIDISRSVEALLSAAKKELLIEIRPVFFPEGYKPDVVFVDSLTSIASAFSGESSRFRVYMEQLFKYLESENIMSFLIRETTVPTHIGKNIIRKEEAVSFLSDGIIALYNVILPSGERTGGIEVLKMRGESFDKRIVRMEITSKGIKVFPGENIDIGNIIT